MDTRTGLRTLSVAFTTLRILRDTIECRQKNFSAKMEFLIQ